MEKGKKMAPAEPIGKRAEFLARKSNRSSEKFAVLRVHLELASLLKALKLIGTQKNLR